MFSLGLVDLEDFGDESGADALAVAVPGAAVLLPTFPLVFDEPRDEKQRREDRHHERDGVLEACRDCMLCVICTAIKND